MHLDSHQSAETQVLKNEGSRPKISVQSGDNWDYLMDSTLQFY